MTKTEASTGKRKFDRLVAVSNRTAAGEGSRAGGLAVALWDTLAETKGLWIGWSGEILDYPKARPAKTVEDGVSFALSDLSKPEYESYYLGFSNSVLWPVLHNRLDLAVFNSEYFESYEAINWRFARIVAEESRPGDLVWVHDYHFLLLAKFLKQTEWTGPCGFFLHIPFPGAEIFRAIPQHRELGLGLISYDVIGLQTKTDVENLRMYLESEFDAKVLDEEHIEVRGRTIQLRHCPIGIDVDGFSLVATEPVAEEAAARISSMLGQRDLVIGVDRMDYSKGLPQRFKGMATLLEQRPSLHGKISYTQIAPPSRSVVGEYVQLRQQLDELTGRINGDYGDLDWIPIRYLARGYKREEIAGLYRLAKIALVTPLQDGMNLVAKEFIAAQDPEDPGVLILSQFAGAAEQMTEALIVNPHDNQAVADAVYEALKMPLDERKRRWQALYKGIHGHDIRWWREHFLAGFDAKDDAAT